jgi:hypothetical protein
MTKIPGSSEMGSVVDTAALAQVFSNILGSLADNSFH